ncbi:hypothetical protein [Pontibacter anaerobius]|uniref:Uncharacterized protein n=1 Tax=Pontibacter anaerobius TaxID=2993940 RepID=A0ABT3RGM0_9BACT|nr:hypothetical protein [Pontibacter anaerobius]MCX2740700.1 hypothetical protein [Pontibacter anaerobius]
MKIVILIFVILLAVGATIKNSANETKKISERLELNKYKSQPNLLPVVEIVATRA